MDLYEYQARDMFEAHGVPVLRGITATTPEEARAAAAELGTPVVVVKAQVKTGGRGKAGGVKIARSPDEAAERAGDILGMDIKGHTVRTVMIAEGADIAEEYYFSLLLDRANRRYLAMCSKEGGMDIETLAVERPEALARVPVDPLVGIDQAKADEIVAAAGFAGDDAAEIARVLQLLGKVYQAEDATLVEVNPLVKTGDGSIVALDGKVSLDENADFRQPEHEALADKSAEDPLEAAAKAKDLNYVKLDGSVGIIGNGAGLVMSTLDVVAYAGEEFAGLAQAGQLPRHRRRRQRGGDGQRAGDHHLRRAGEERLRQRVRRHHRLRRGGQRHRAGLRAAGQPGRARRRPAGRPAGRQQRRAGPEDPHRRRTCRGWSRSTRWTERPAGPPSWLRPDRKRSNDVDLSERRLPGPRPGHDRLRGAQAHLPDAGVGHQDRRRA